MTAVLMRIALVSTSVATTDAENLASHLSALTTTRPLLKGPHLNPPEVLFFRNFKMTLIEF